MAPALLEMLKSQALAEMTRSCTLGICLLVGKTETKWWTVISDAAQCCERSALVEVGGSSTTGKNWMNLHPHVDRCPRSPL